MILERRAVDLIAAATAAPTYFGRQPQPPDDHPAPLPLVIVGRIGSIWAVTHCGTDINAEVATLQVDYFADSAEEARRLADRGRAAMAQALADENGAKVLPSLVGEFSQYDDESRAWRVVQSWQAMDQAPAIAP